MMGYFLLLAFPTFQLFQQIGYSTSYLSYKKLRETLVNKFLSCHKSLQYTYHETLKATEICIKKFVNL